MGRLLLILALFVAVAALVRQSGWLFWQEWKNALVLACTIAPYLLSLWLMSGFRRSERPGILGAATWVALGVFLLTCVLYLPDGLGGPAFVVYPGLIFLLGVSAFLVIHWRAFREG
ncbi:hypothetical protein [Deinococcus budaensis]|uniref:FtsH-binding integral membrane protein n=1 Tax=Deinococcus budaensis TaxID=1665626 RepID=A0A7W8LPG3_9DEIO|nr:hypothetical protein [Deinococcus budaensis]MBB5233748.1 FtsH-binding integral membrane protein [Deinococcus budaensis]